MEFAVLIPTGVRFLLMRIWVFRAARAARALRALRAARPRRRLTLSGPVTRRWNRPATRTPRPWSPIEGSVHRNAGMDGA